MLEGQAHEGRAARAAKGAIECVAASAPAIAVRGLRGASPR